MNKINANKISVKIDGKTVEAPMDSTVLQAAQKAGIYIPTLCYLEALKPYGGCRLCIVEIKNMRGYPTACTTPVAPEMEIVTNSPELLKLRREILALTLSEHPYTCLVCKDKNDCKEFIHTTRKVSVTTGCNFCTNNGDCELQNLVEYLEMKEVQFPISYKSIKPVDDNPFYKLDYNLCILCGRCVRICNEERQSGVLAFVQRGNATIVGTAFGKSQIEAGCEFCGACADVCPTGSISEKLGSWAGLPDKSLETTCIHCSVACSMNINTLANRIVNIGPKPGERLNPPQLCIRGKFTNDDLVHNPDRILTPLIKKNNKWIETGWNEVINFAASNLERYRGNQFGIIGSGHDITENNYVLQKFARKVMRSNNVDLLSSYPDKSVAKKIHDYYRIFQPPKIDDIPNADTIFIIGSQASWSHPIIENRIRKAYKLNKDIINANAYDNRTSCFTKYNLIYTPGTEQILLLCLLNNLNKHNPDVQANEFKEIFNNFNFDKALNTCGTSGQEIEEVAKAIISSGKFLIIAGDGILQNADSVNLFNTLLNIQKFSKKPEAARILFLFEEGNRYGSLFAGMHPDYLPGFEHLDDESVKKWSDNWNTTLSNIQGLSGDEMINKIQEDGITALLITGDIPAHPNLANLKFLIQQNMFLTETSKYANVFFPLTNFTEMNGHILNVEQRIKKINPVIKPAGNLKTSWEIISLLAGSMFENGFNYAKIEDIFKEIKSFTDNASDSNSNIVPQFLNNISQTMLHEEEQEFPIKLIIEQNSFHYTGNILSSLIPDIQKIRHEGVLKLSYEVAEQLDIKDGDNVRITTKFGQGTEKVKIIPELIGKTACLLPNRNHLPLLSNGLNINSNFIDAKIEKQ
ncbi:MAG: molybdopterin-dependent oxidoreductase [Bacteroidia bacterium]|nr:molybdopterin-dependent oxidoreductase [Bacteroidia bacterium]